MNQTEEKLVNTPRRKTDGASKPLLRLSSVLPELKYLKRH